MEGGGGTLKTCTCVFFSIVKQPSGRGLATTITNQALVVKVETRNDGTAAASVKKIKIKMRRRQNNSILASRLLKMQQTLNFYLSI